MRLSVKLADRLAQIISLVILLALTAALISAVRSGKLPYITDPKDYAYNYAYTDESAETE